MDIKTVCGTVNPGSNPGTLAIQGDNMKMKIEKQNTKQACKIDEDTVFKNGIGPFCEHPTKENCWIYKGRMQHQIVGFSPTVTKLRFTM